MMDGNTTTAPAWNGYPENPEVSGWHMLRHRAGDLQPEEWLGEDHVTEARGWNGIPGEPEHAARDGFTYIGPITMPAEVAHLRQTVTDLSDMLRRAARVFRDDQAQHLAKETPEGAEKAKRNGDMANAIEAALFRAIKPADVPAARNRTMG